MKWLIGVVILSLCFALVGCNQQSTVSTGYYRNVVILPNGDFEVLDRINEAKAKTGPAYYVQLNDLNKIIKVEYQIAGNPASIEWDYEACPGFFYYYHGGFSSIQVYYDNEHIIYTFKSSDGSLSIGGLSAASSIRFLLNEKGVRTSAFFYGRDGKLSTDYRGYSQAGFTI